MINRAMKDMLIKGRVHAERHRVTNCDIETLACIITAVIIISLMAVGPLAAASGANAGEETTTEMKS